MVKHLKKVDFKNKSEKYILRKIYQYFKVKEFLLLKIYIKHIGNVENPNNIKGK